MPEKLLFLLLWLMICLNVSAQENDFSWFKYDSKNGLPSNETYRVFQDSKGFIWISTDHGLVRYDGYRFNVFTTSNGLTDNTVFDIGEGKNGLLWINTYLGGICIGNENGFRPHPDNDTIKTINVIAGFYTAQTDSKGNWWMGMVPSASFNFDLIKLTEDTIIFFTGEENTGKGMLFIDDNNLYHKTFRYSAALHEELRTDFDSVEAIPFNDKEEGFLKKYFTGNSDSKYLYCNSHHELAVISKSTRKTVYEETFSNILNSVNIIDNEIWVCEVNNGVHKYVWKNDTLIHTGHYFTHSTVSDVLKDREGNYWFSTTDAGVYFVPDIKVDFVKNKTGEALDSKITWLGVIENTLYAATGGYEKMAIDTKTGRAINSNKALTHGEITAMSAINGKITSNTEVNMQIEEPFKKFNGKVNSPILIKQVDHYPGNKLITGGGGGILICTTDFELEWSSVSAGFGGKTEALVHAADSTYYIGSNHTVYEMKGRSIRTFYKSSLLDNARIRDIKVNHTGELIVATRGAGVIILENGNDHYITEKNGLISDLCEKVYIENDSVFWIATYSGISKITWSLKNNTLNTSIKSYSTLDGLCSNQVNAIQGYKGKIWLGTNEGLCFFDPAAIEPADLEIPLYFSSLKINGDPSELGSLTELSYNQNNITVDFVALHYRSQSGVRYKVRLRETDEWISTYTNSIHYFDLAPGDYQLQVMADDDSGRYHSVTKTLQFTINKKFTDTLLFRTGLLTGILLLITIGAFYYIRNQRARAQNRISLMQSEYKALNYQINPHFIFNIFNSIQYFIIKKNTDKAIFFLNAFSAMIRNVMKNAGNTTISVMDECESLREYLGLEQMRMDNRFKFEFIIDSNVDVIKKSIMPMIIQPIVENSIWHGVSPDEKNCMIRIHFSKTGNAVTCTVDDDGVGLKKQKTQPENPSKKSLSIALENVRERLRIAADLYKTNYIFELHDKSDLDPGTTGTLVIIKFPEINDSN